MPSVVVEELDAERQDTLPPDWPKLSAKAATPQLARDPGLIQCWDPATMHDLGTVAVSTPADIEAAVRRARAAQQQWSRSSWDQRRRLLDIIRRFIVEHATTVVRVACRDSGKTPIDAVFGELAVTCEKLRWTAARGESWLQVFVRTK